MNATTATTAVNGSKLLAECTYDRRLCAAIISTRPDWQELLDSIMMPQQRRNVVAVVVAIREALGQDSDYAREITQGQ
jgi:hypothetical protein